MIQEIARSHDQPASHADDLIAEAAFGNHPLGRSVLGTEERLRAFSRDDVASFRERRWRSDTGGVFLAGNLDALEPATLEALLDGFQAPPPAPRAEGHDDAPGPAPRAPRVLVDQRDSKQSHLRIGYRPDIDVADPDTRAALALCVSLLGGSMGSRLVDEIREQRGLAYSVRAYDYTAGDQALVQLSAGLDSSRCIEAYERMLQITAELAADGPSQGEIDRARALLTGRQVLSFESTASVAMHAAHEVIVYGDSPAPSAWISRLEKVGDGQVREVAAALHQAPAVACVGPHGASDFS